MRRSQKMSVFRDLDGKEPLLIALFCKMLPAVQMNCPSAQRAMSARGLKIPPGARISYAAREIV